MFIPHSDRKVINVQINAMILFGVAALLVAVMVVFFYLATVYSGTEQNIVEKASSLDAAESSLDGTRAQIKDMMKSYSSFQDTMSGTLKELNIQQANQDSSGAGGGDLANVKDVQELSNTELREVLDIKRLSQAFSAAIDPLNEISQAWKTQKQLLSDIPNLWPLVDGRTAISLDFGPARNPLRYDWFIHRGVDIAGPVGLPVVASANGKVIEAQYDTSAAGYGAYIVIEHKYGFRTRYSHLATYFVRPGDEVYQGQRIGTLGNTGESVDAHLQFEIMLGTQVLDPTSFLKITDSTSGEAKISASE